MSTVKLREDLKAAKDRAYSLKTKKAKEKAWTKVREIKRQILIGLYAEREQFAVFSVKGTVVVDNSHCMAEHIGIETSYGLFWVSPANDILSKSWYASTCCVEYQEGQQVIVELEADVNSERLGLFLYPKRVYGGTLNETKYAELCKRDNLAFFKYPELKGGMTGLFASPKAVSNE